LAEKLLNPFKSASDFCLLISVLHGPPKPFGEGGWFPAQDQPRPNSMDGID